jgi:hypothetical protein
LIAGNAEDGPRARLLLAVAAISRGASRREAAGIAA